MAPVLDVCIRGAGIVGRTLALLLARERLRVGLVQGPPPPARDVRAYALNAASRQLLESVRAWPDAAHATPVRGMEVRGDEGGLVNFEAGAQAALAWIVDVPALEDRLNEALRYQALVTPLEEPARAPLTVVCEGRMSATRDEFGVVYDVQPYGQHAVAARLGCEKPHGHVARQWFQGGEILALLPLGGEAGAQEVALVWSAGESRAAYLRQAPAAEFQQQLKTLTGGALGALTLRSDRASWPLQLARADRWSGPGWALAGDAAHAVHPLAGQGLNLGLADARALAQVLHEREYWRTAGDARLLRRYERARKGDVLAMGATTDGLQQLFAQAHPAWAMFRNAGMRGFDASGPIKQWVVRQAAGRL
ncbi:FAD-dependent monooxygenase [Ramlibacter humi]|uniref:Ubiquinone biosynthesis protein UbiH n=1 Tax=Ramlibacter humi TaxID=2530451 RepID=A0A4Z0BZD0_9BURK|nr:FAD-dependent monooxygenase [Ramlibacter humi]TFZ03640.1 ubiquinone biosynthesis protein UbiH [Ramlibacter humi]